MLSNVFTSLSFSQAGGKADGAQGVGTDVDKVQAALEVAREQFSKVS